MGDSLKLSAKWAFFASGRGSNFSAVMNQCEFKVSPVFVTNKKECEALKKAQSLGLDVHIMDYKSPDVIKGLSDYLSQHHVQKIFLLGFMRILPASFIEPWVGSIFNLHPSLLPEFPGLHAIEESFKAGSDMGVSIHHVTAGVDEGQVLKRTKVINSSEIPSFTLEQATDRIHQVEHQMVVDFVRGI